MTKMISRTTVAITAVLLCSAAVFAAVHAAKTTEDLKSAYMGETTAHAKYAAYASIAEKDGYIAEARMFRAASAAEEIHARNHKRALAKLGVANPEAGFFEPTVMSTKPVDQIRSELKDAVAGETYEYNTMYPGMMQTARNEHQATALRSDTYAMKVEGRHAAMFQTALYNLGHNRVYPYYSVCRECGSTWPGRGPAVCPICRHPRSSFLRIR